MLATWISLFECLWSLLLMQSLQILHGIAAMKHGCMISVHFSGTTYAVSYHFNEPRYIASLVSQQRV
ncbi:hypothetical protein Pla52n_07760 [Stieleria varia]|uniref:Uncharacterized protein n=1 Tax=Stieleria varia TaxID=2528005 RepID=A0A5C6BCJ3_9BACT|nr:hypothetical protein Pla52n_07760 [Stieleria varia]